MFNNISSDFNNLLNNDILNKDILNNDILNKDILNNDILNNDILNNDTLNNYIKNNYENQDIFFIDKKGFIDKEYIDTIKNWLSISDYEANKFKDYIILLVQNEFCFLSCIKLPNNIFLINLYNIYAQIYKTKIVININNLSYGLINQKINTLLDPDIKIIIE